MSKSSLQVAPPKPANSPGARRKAGMRFILVVVLIDVEAAGEEAVGTFRVWSASKGEEGKAG